MFGDDDDEDGTADQILAIDQFCNEAFIEIMHLRPFLKRQLDEKAELIMPRCIGILVTDPKYEETLANKFVNRLKVAKFDKVEIIHLKDINTDQLGKQFQCGSVDDCYDEAVLDQTFPMRLKSFSSYQYDALIVYDDDGVKCNECIAKIASYMIIAGGLLLLGGNDKLIDSSTSGIHSLLSQSFSPNKSHTSTSTAANNGNNSNNCLCLKRKYIHQNISATPYWSPNITTEALLLEKITCCLSVAERRLQLFSDATQHRATECLKTHGLVIFKGVYDKQRVVYWGDCAKRDMTQVVWKLRERGIDLLKDHDDDEDEDDGVAGGDDEDKKDSSDDNNNVVNGDEVDTTTINKQTQHHHHRQKRQTERSVQPVQMIENYHEMSMREARRCDLRNGYAMKKAAVLAATDQQLQSQQKKHSSSDGVQTADIDIRHHQGIIDVISATANALYYSNINNDEDDDEESNKPLYRGNWGRWNFEGQGPDGPPAALTVGQVGAVMSMPGCVDQTIHADTSHIVTHTQLPGHYFNFFLPAATTTATPDEDDNEDDVYAKGQTAFILNSHLLSVAYDVMVAETGAELLNELLVRPHLQLGDGLVFDCRILHLGLANRYHINQQQQSADDDDKNKNTSSSNGNGENNTDSTTTSIKVNTTSAAFSSSSSVVVSPPPLDTSGWRPMLYINYHQPWFIDPKNWNNNEKLFGTE